MIGSSGCSTTQQTTDDESKKQPDIYVFDDVDKVDSLKTTADTTVIEPTELAQRAVVLPEKTLKFIVQVGAFSTKERAESFVSENQSKLDLKMAISFNESTQLQVVQLPPFSTRESAEEYRNKIWKIPVFRDAFIITIEE